MGDSETTTRPVVVLDKSFAQSSKPGQLEELSREYVIVVTSSFYFESFTPLRENRARVLAKLPEFRRIHTPHLYQYERDNRTPAESMEAARLEINPQIVEGSRILLPEEEDCIRSFETSVVRPQLEFWKEVITIGVVGFEDSELRSTASNLPKFFRLCERLRDAEFIRQVASQMNIPHAEFLDERWYTFGMLQCIFLHALTLKFLSNSPDWHRADKDLEHDVHDIDYLSLGVHARGFATDESVTDFKKLGWKFKFLRPHGRILHADRGSNPHSASK